MITAVDTSVLSDIFLRDSQHYGPSSALVRRALSEGALIACSMVWAEIAALFHSEDLARETLERLTVGYSEIDEAGSLRAGTAWRSYRRSGGTRKRVIPDFLIAAHALSKADRLLTRDRGFYRSYFKDLKLLDPQGQS